MQQLEEEDQGWHLEVPAPEPKRKEGPDLHYFLLGDNTFVLMPWLVKTYSRRQLTREERVANYRISRGSRVVENTFVILASRFRALLVTMEQRPKVVRYIVLTCVVLLMTHQEGADRAPNLADDIAALQNEQVVYVPDDYRNLLREAKNQQDLPKDYFDHLGVLAGQEDRI